MKVRTRKLLSLLLTLAMVAGMFVLPASAAEDTGSHVYIASKETTPSDAFFTQAGSVTQQSDRGTLTYNGETLEKGAKVGSGWSLTFKIPDGATNATIKIGYSASNTDKRLDLTKPDNSVQQLKPGTTKVGTEETITNAAVGTWKLARANGDMYLFYIEVTYTPASNPDAPKHTITKGEESNGTFTVDPASEAAEGATVTVAATPAEGYKVSAVTYTPDGGEAAAATKKDANTYTFAMPAADVTVNVTFEAGHEATPQTYKLSETIAAMKATGGYKEADPLLAGPVYNSGYFSLVADGSAEGLQFRDKSGIWIEVGAAEKNNGIEFTVESTANVTVKISSTGSSNWSVAALKKDGENQVIATSTAGDATVNLYADGDLSGSAATAGSNAKVAHIKTAKQATFTYTNLAAGTYRLYSPEVSNAGEADPSTRGFRVYEIEVVEADAEKKPDIEDKEVTKVTVTPATLALDTTTNKTGNLTFTVEPEDALNRQVEWKSSNTSVATVKVEKGKVVVTAVGGGTAEIIATSVKTGTVSGKCTVTVTEIKTMKNASPEPQSKSYKPGQTLYANVKVVDAATGADIPNVTYTYAIVTGDTVGEYTSTKPSQTNVGTTTYKFKANADGYEEFTSVEARNINVTKADPVLSIKAEPNRVKQANDADRYTIITVDCTNIEGANVNAIEVSGKNLTANQQLLENRFVKQSDGVYKVSFPEPDVSEAEYVFTASFGGNDNYNAATDQTARVTVVNSTVVDRTYKLNYDAETIRIKYTSDGSTDDAVLYGAGVEAEAIVPEGKEFVKWVSADLNPTDADWDTQNPTKFAMPGHDVKLEVVFQDKTEETDPANRTQLSALLRTAEEWMKVPEVDTDAANVDKGVDWVKAEDKATFKTAIDTAQAVASNDKATQAQVNEAVEKLDKAIADFKATWKKGTKTEGSSEPTTTEYVLDPTTLTAAADKETVTADELAGTVVFGVTGTVMKRVSSTTNKVYAVDTDKPSNGGAITIKIPAGATATVEAQVASNGGTNTSNFELQKDGVKVNNEENLDSVTGSTDAAVTVNYTGLTEGTYSLLTPVGAANSNRGVRVVKVTVSVTTAGGGDEPVIPESAARKALKDAVAAAKEAAEAVKVSTDGEDVSTSEMWVTKAAMTAFESAIELAETKAASPKFDDEALTAAKTALENAKTIFVGAQRRGKKTSSSSGGGGGDNVPSTGGGSTVKNEDGSKTTTKTNNSTGTVTETTTWPNGDKQVIVTEKDGTKTETFTKKDGSKTVTVTKPDGSTSTAVTDTKGITVETATDASGATSGKVSLPNRIDSAVVSVPVSNPTEGTVAVIVDAKGNETILKTTVINGDILEMLVKSNISFQIKDNAKNFIDIADGYWAKGAVDFVSSREIFKGTTDVTFSPADEVNRGMMATVLYRLADGKAEGENVFFDVADGTWYTDAVIWANRSGVVTGYADGTFGPDKSITREEMATMLFRYAKALKMDVSAKGNMSSFGDSNDVASWASEAMAWCVGAGLINGVGDPALGTILAPSKTASRAEIATIMQRMVKLMMQ